VAEAESPAIGVRCLFQCGCAAAGIYGRLPVTETGIVHYRVSALSEPQGEDLRSESALNEAGGSSFERPGEDSPDPGKTSVRDEQFMRFVCGAVRHTRDIDRKTLAQRSRILVGFPESTSFSCHLEAPQRG
jgi:hypothetical protein